MPKFTYNSQLTTKFEFSQAKSLEINKTPAKYTVVYIHGLCSDPWGAKPEEIKRICLAENLNFMRFELAGHGSDCDNYVNVDFHDWKRQTLQTLDMLTFGKVLMVGSSIGGWLSLLAAEERPERVAGVITLAAAPDCQNDLYARSFSKEQVERLEQRGQLEVATPDFTYVFTKKLIDSCRAYPTLGRPLEIFCPLHLLHGMQDASISWEKAAQIAGAVLHNNVTVKLLKGADHRLSRPEDFAEFHNSLRCFL